MSRNRRSSGTTNRFRYSGGEPPRCLFCLAQKHVEGSFSDSRCRHCFLFQFVISVAMRALRNVHICVSGPHSVLLSLLADRALFALSLAIHVRCGDLTVSQGHARLHRHPQDWSREVQRGVRGHAPVDPPALLHQSAQARERGQGRWMRFSDGVGEGRIGRKLVLCVQVPLCAGSKEGVGGRCRT